MNHHKAIADELSRLSEQIRQQSDWYTSKSISNWLLRNAVIHYQKAAEDE